MSDQNAGTTDTAMGMFWIGCVVVALLLLFWHFQQDVIKSGIRWIRYGEMWLAQWFTSDDKAFTLYNQSFTHSDLLRDAPNLKSSEINGAVLGVLTEAALDPYRWIIVVILVIMGAYLYFRGPESEFRNKFSMDSLIDKQATTFPVIQPFVKFNPAKIPPRPPGSPIPAELPLFSEALGPEEWIAYNQIPIRDNELDEKATEAVFTKQLGPRWKGAKNLPKHKMIILAACCLKASRKRSEADEMLGRLSLCWSHDKGLQFGKDKSLVGDAKRVLKKKDLSAKTLALCNQHAYQNTALIRALFHARSEGGVLAPAQFVWMRGYDRTLWYPLNNLGRNSFHMEAIGAICHYKAEKMVKRPIPKPKLKDAISSITDYMKSDIARPVPQVNYAGSKKRGIKKAKA